MTEPTVTTPSPAPTSAVETATPEPISLPDDQAALDAVADDSDGDFDPEGDELLSIFDPAVQTPATVVSPASSATLTPAVVPTAPAPGAASAAAVAAPGTAPATVPAAAAPAVAPAAQAAPAAATPAEPVNYAKWREDAETQLAEKHFVLDERLIQEIQDDPAAITKALPKLAARLYMDAVTASVQAIIGHMPGLIERVVQQSSESRDADKMFFDSWPALKDQRAKVEELGRVWRQSNPKADAATFIKEVGAWTTLALGLPLTANGSAPVAAPAAARTVPFQPPTASAPRAGLPAQAPNMFEALAAEQQHFD